MRLKSTLIAAALGLIAPLHATGATATPLLQAITPERYAKMPVEQRQIYVAGVFDADRALFTYTQAQFAACLGDGSLTLAQLTDIVDRALSTLSPELREAMPFAVHNAFAADCNRRGIRTPQ